MIQYYTRMKILSREREREEAGGGRERSIAMHISKGLWKLGVLSHWRRKLHKLMRL